MKTAAVRYQLRAQGRYFVPGPNMFGGITGRSPGERPHYGIAGETSPGKRDLVWTQGQSEEFLLVQPLYSKSLPGYWTLFPAGGATMIDGFEHNSRWLHS